MLLKIYRIPSPAALQACICFAAWVPDQVWGVLRDSVPFMRFRGWGGLGGVVFGGWGGCSLTFGKVAGFLHGCFSRFLNCTNDTKSCKASQSVNLTSIFTASRAFLQGCLIIIDYDELLVAIVWLSWTIARNPNHLKLWHVLGEVRT